MADLGASCLFRAIYPFWGQGMGFGGEPYPDLRTGEQADQQSNLSIMAIYTPGSGSALAHMRPIWSPPTLLWAPGQKPEPGCSCCQRPRVLRGWPFISTGTVCKACRTQSVSQSFGALGGGGSYSTVGMGCSTTGFPVWRQSRVLLSPMRSERRMGG